MYLPAISKILLSLCDDSIFCHTLTTIKIGLRSWIFHFKAPALCPTWMVLVSWVLGKILQPPRSTGQPSQWSPVVAQVTRPELLSVSGNNILKIGIWGLLIFLEGVELWCIVINNHCFCFQNEHLDLLPDQFSPKVLFTSQYSPLCLLSPSRRPSRSPAHDCWCCLHTAHCSLPGPDMEPLPA